MVSPLKKKRTKKRTARGTESVSAGCVRRGLRRATTALTCTAPRCRLGLGQLLSALDGRLRRELGVLLAGGVVMTFPLRSPRCLCILHAAVWTRRGRGGPLGCLRWPGPPLLPAFFASFLCILLRVWNVIAIFAMNYYFYNPAMPCHFYSPAMPYLWPETQGNIIETKFLLWFLPDWAMTSPQKQPWG